MPRAPLACPTAIAPAHRTAAHPLAVRITHWLNAGAITIMVTSGWRIYDASPLFGFSFPHEITLGGWLGGALQWHFAAMWLVIANTLAYLVYGIGSGHFRRSFFPISARAFVRDVASALQGRLTHRPGTYNTVQRLSYVVVTAAIVLTVFSGLAIWKPTQFGALAFVMGGYEGARVVHFFGMAAIVAFVVIHLALVLIVPATLIPMISGWAHRKSASDAPTTKEPS